MEMVAGIIVGVFFGMAMCSCMILSSRRSREDEIFEEKYRREHEDVEQEGD